jgi:hypothetical protein
MPAVVVTPSRLATTGPDRSSVRGAGRGRQPTSTGVHYAEGIRLTDPRGMAVYFAKYGATGRKEYQHHVPREYPEDGDECLDCGRPRGSPNISPYSPSKGPPAASAIDAAASVNNC